MIRPAPLLGLLEKSPEARKGFPVGADLRVRPVAGAALLEGFLPVGVPAPGIRSICELRLPGGHAGLWDSPEEGLSLQRTQTLFHRGFLTPPCQGLLKKPEKGNLFMCRGRIYATQVFSATTRATCMRLLQKLFPIRLRQTLVHRGYSTIPPQGGFLLSPSAGRLFGQPLFPGIRR